MLKHDQVQMKKQNRKIVLDRIRNHEPISRIQLAKITKMSPTTITRIVQELIEEDYIIEAMSEETAIGRRPTLINVNPEARYSIGVEIDRSKLRIGLLNFSCELVDFVETPLMRSESYEWIIDNLVLEIQKLILTNQISQERLLGIGIGIPGRIDQERGIVIISEQFKWKNKHVRDDLAQHFQCTIAIDNELKMQIFAESGKFFKPIQRNSILIGVGSGIGAAIILNGEIYRGLKNNAGEISHLTINPFGEQCSCGNRGCLSNYTREDTLQQFIPEAQRSEYNTLEKIVEGIHANEEWSIPLIDHIATYLAITINNLICIYEPDEVIVTGEALEKNIKIQNVVLAKCEKHIWRDIGTGIQIKFSELNETGVVKGAAMFVQKVEMEI
ncbi:ROK family transcriptional regulator [Solibacillus sp. MA9]|uniref:ROK family transcriptional regulator n=1 Tax=Solibacillus palustris TaxID=2908203 RepID=A0ABS9UGY9_9BACL|nr:ROK family transcriptional regulator [Solibacillus sp. MA9]MCH7323400.1 ROK family transcriptional regulator [Solibacillus sp. MA9]